MEDVQLFVTGMKECITLLDSLQGTNFQDFVVCYWELELKYIDRGYPLHINSCIIWFIFDHFILQNNIKHKYINERLNIHL